MYVLRMIKNHTQIVRTRAVARGGVEFSETKSTPVLSTQTGNGWAQIDAMERPGTSPPGIETATKAPQTFASRVNYLSHSLPPNWGAEVERLNSKFIREYYTLKNGKLQIGCTLPLYHAKIRYE
jgi:hypothetical protein